MYVQVEHNKQLECLLIQHVKQQEELGRKSVGGVHEEINIEHAQEWYVQVLSICTLLGISVMCNLLCRDSIYV